MALKPCLGRCGRLTRRSYCRTCNPYQQGGWRALSRAVIARDRVCQRCGSTHRLQAHHVIPRVQGGPDTMGNLVALCASCHAKEEAL